MKKYLLGLLLCFSVVPASAQFIIKELGLGIGYGANLKNYEKTLAWAGFNFIGESKSDKEKVGQFFGTWGPFANSQILVHQNKGRKRVHALDVINQVDSYEGFERYIKMLSDLYGQPSNQQQTDQFTMLWWTFPNKDGIILTLVHENGMVQITYNCYAASL